MENHGVRHAELERLDAFVGDWRMAASFSVAPPNRAGVGSNIGSARATFEWALGGQFLVQRSDAPPPAPDSIAIIALDLERDGYTQHYFDSRGVVRVYAMKFRGGTWTLSRTSSDFSSLDFWQRFTGAFSDDGNTIEGRWETSNDDGASWTHDFDLSYARITAPSD